MCLSLLIGNRYLHPTLTKDEVAKVVKSYEDMGWWP